MKETSQLRKKKRRPNNRTPIQLMERRQELLNQKRQPQDQQLFNLQPHAILSFRQNKWR
jgi:hypothetical protein